ncbi:TetR/AcrR family transcriptional regulator [Devosia aquimaris]|uniref:TetR/AcrR family transcriptional regulator n=1 Tax=Devosia aquimaris TaxID=2866214 RepID=UPI001CD17292|nr:TetR/AcrR family transcriptional regulator [Devosia sp. CJK-A8-3]
MTKGSRAAAKQARPREILEAAFEEFSLRGYAATRLDDIAARVGVTKGTIYVYFENKETLFETMVVELSTPEHDTTPYLAELETSAASALEHLLRNVYAEALSDRYSREILRLLIAEKNTFQSLSRRFKDNFAGPVFGSLQQILQKGSETGEFAPQAASIDPFFILSPFLGYFVLDLVLPEDSPEADSFLGTHIEMVKRLVAPIAKP